MSFYMENMILHPFFFFERASQMEGRNRNLRLWFQWGRQGDKKEVKGRDSIEDGNYHRGVRGEIHTGKCRSLKNY